MKLYTSLVRLKQSLNGGVLPPMTPLNDRARKILDPAFANGMGSLVESEAGLRCPVRGCGEYHHSLRLHMNRIHGEIGGSHAITRVLSIPSNVPLISEDLRVRLRASFHSSGGLERLNSVRAKARRRSACKRAGKQRRHTNASVNLRNFRNRCEAQIRHTLIDLHHQLGRTPSVKETDRLVGCGFRYYLIETYGTWNAAMAKFGFRPNTRSKREVHATDRDTALSSLSAYFEVRKKLPSRWQSEKPSHTPLLPAPNEIIRGLGARDWDHAMEIAASLLNIQVGRYGLSLNTAPVADAAD